MKNFFVNVLKGVGMGVANVIPGVSGGTIALIVGIFERLINSLKSFNFKALKLLFTGKFKEFAKYTDFVFLIEVLLGIALAMVSVAKLFKFLFENYPIYIWSFFLGLLLASIFYVGKAINPAHQNPDLPINFNIKMNLVQELSEALKKMGKRIKVSYF